MSNYKFIVEHGLQGRVKHTVAGAETIEDLDRYLGTDPHPGYRLVNVQWLNENHILVWEEKDDGWQTLVDAVKMAYRKHVNDDPDIGWTALCEKLGEALSQTMGPEKFSEWVEEVRQ